MAAFVQEVMAFPLLTPTLSPDVVVLTQSSLPYLTMSISEQAHNSQ